MPLPVSTPGLTWPPPQLGVVTPQLEEWSAWYSGDTQALRGHYQGSRAARYARPSQYAGGIVGAVSRMFWGTPPAVGQQDTKLHVPVASDIATASADLLFAEDVAITYDLGNDTAPDGTSTPSSATKAAQARLDAILDANNWASLLLEAAEVDSALGGVYLRCTWDTSIDADRPILSAVHADAAVPEFAYGRLRAVTFWREVKRQGSAVWRHLERHEPGLIQHGLYVGTDNYLGDPRPLSDHPDTAGITLTREDGIPTGYPGLSAVYVPNMRPNRLWRNLPQAANLGRSDLAGIEGQMDALDETLTSWMRDVRLGKARLLVPEYMLTNAGPGSANTWNIDQEVFQLLNTPPTSDGTFAQQISPQQFAIRHAEHSQTMQQLLGIIFRGAGYSASTFGLADAEGAQQTATEVSARERRSTTTREKKTRYWVDGLREFLVAVAAIDRAQFRPRQAIPEGAVPLIEFAPSSAPTPEQLAATVQLLDAAEAVSTDTKVRMLHPDWVEADIAQEVAKILEERAASMPADPFAIPPGAEGGGDPEADDPFTPADQPPQE